MTEQLLSSNHFPSTNWSLVRHAGDRLDVQQSDALQTLLTRYWPALKKHLVRRKHLQESDADDLVQGFIERKVLERNLMATAEPSRGRFRSLLVRSLDNYVANQFERITAKKALQTMPCRWTHRINKSGSTATRPPMTFSTLNGHGKS